MFIPINVLACGLLLPTLAPASGSDAKNIDAVAKQAFAPLPGKAAVVFAELTDNGPAPLFELHGNERFAIGSSFKLFILGVLAEEVNADRRQLADVMTLQPQWIGPPHSELAEWPIGSPVTLHTLALKMISISDNTATDHLLHLLAQESRGANGRYGAQPSRVEPPAIGHARNGHASRQEYGAVGPCIPEAG